MKPLIKSNSAAIGIGAMIVFIAMVLVAGIAASVLIQTSTKLESQAMKTGQDTIGEVATGIAVTQVQGHYNDGNGIDFLGIHIRARAGSADIDLSETVVELSDSASKNILIYAGATAFDDTGDISGDIFTGDPWTNADATQFGLIVLEDADGSVTESNPVINAGDHVIVTIDANSAFGYLTTRTDVFGEIIPEEGAPGVVAFTTPASYTDAVIELQ